MIVPEYWAEAKERVVIDGSAATYKRFGWSDESHEAAYENARERVLEAAARARQGDKVRLIDHKVTYNGAEGLPIREQVVARHGDTVITRNSYGALCLNTPGVLFADVDIDQPNHVPLSILLFFLLLLTGAALWVWTGQWLPLALFALAGVLLSGILARSAMRLFVGSRDRQFEKALQRIEVFVSSRSDWAIRVYRTPNGYRLLVEHRLFDPGDEQVYDFMSAVGTDKTYMQMCRNQKCFRARLTPKPWRIDMRHIAPRPGIWPIKDERMAERDDWINEYQAASRDYAACRYEKTLGSGRADRNCARVRQYHDDMSRANRSLPIA